MSPAEADEPPPPVSDTHGASDLIINTTDDAQLRKDWQRIISPSDIGKTLCHML